MVNKMEIMTREMINKGLTTNGALAGKLPNRRQADPTRAINEEIKLIRESRKKEALAVKEKVNVNNIPNIDDCVEQVSKDTEWSKGGFDLVYGKAYEGGIRNTEALEPLIYG